MRIGRCWPLVAPNVADPSGGTLRVHDRIVVELKADRLFAAGFDATCRRVDCDDATCTGADIYVELAEQSGPAIRMRENLDHDLRGTRAGVSYVPGAIDSRCVRGKSTTHRVIAPKDQP